jgi:ribosome maturation factor RimP
LLLRKADTPVNTARPVGPESQPAHPSKDPHKGLHQGLASGLFEQLTPILAAEQYELVDVEVENVAGGSVLRILLDRAEDHPLGRRIDLEGVAAATRFIDAHFEANDPISEAFTLEVSSPGLERPLRTPAHFLRYIGAEVSVKTTPGTPGERRLQGILTAADPDSSGTVTIDARMVAYGDIDRARTVFRWGEEEALAPGRTAPRKKGALPKGQRPEHPKVKSTAQVAASALASQAPDERLLSNKSSEPGLAAGAKSESKTDSTTTPEVAS